MPNTDLDPSYDTDLAYERSEALADIAAEQAYYAERDEELTGLEEHLRDEAGAFGDARRCPRHPHVKTSSDDGMFDAPCGECEHEADVAMAAWAVDPTNAFRSLCDAGVWFPSSPRFGAAACLDVEDDIAF